jgi:3-oxoacyl-[acyl-carrier-protein] synthase III
VTGILDLAIRYPEGRREVHEMHAASGVPEAAIRAITHTAQIPALSAAERSWELALGAAHELLERTGTEPGAIRQIVFCGSGQWDLPFWSPAAKVADLLNVRNAHCFEIVNFCNAAMVALQTVTDRLVGTGRGSALILAADRLTRLVDYHDPEAKELFNFGDAAAAVLVTAGPARFTLLHSAMRTDPSWSDYYYGEYTPEGVRIRRARHRPGLAASYVTNFSTLIEETLRELDLKLDDIAYLLINQGDKDMHERLLAELGFPAEHSVYNYDRLGHMSGADTFIALDQLHRQGSLRRGDRILLATSAMGFSWGITALEYTR